MGLFKAALLCLAEPLLQHNMTATGSGTMMASVALISLEDNGSCTQGKAWASGTRGRKGKKVCRERTKELPWSMEDSGSAACLMLQPCGKA